MTSQLNFRFSLHGFPQARSIEECLNHISGNDGKVVNRAQKEIPMTEKCRQITYYATIDVHHRNDQCIADVMRSLEYESLYNREKDRTMKYTRHWPINDSHLCIVEFVLMLGLVVNRHGLPSTHPILMPTLVTVSGPDVLAVFCRHRHQVFLLHEAMVMCAGYRHRSL